MRLNSETAASTSCLASAGLLTSARTGLGYAASGFDRDQYLDNDAVFGVKKSLIRTYTRQEPGIAPDGRKKGDTWYRLYNDFCLKPAEA